MKNFYKEGRGLCYLRRLSYLFKSKKNQSRPVFSFVLGSSYILYSVCFGQSLPIDLSQPHKFDYTLYDAVKSIPITSTDRLQKERSKYPKADFSKFPMAQYEIETAGLPKVNVGDAIPDVVLDMPLWVVNDSYGRDTITLRMEMDKEWLILDFWTEWCGPCIGSMNKWEAITRKENANVNLLGVYTSFYTHRTAIETRKKGYLSTQVVGPTIEILKAVFLDKAALLGPSVWIHEGRLFGISKPETLEQSEMEGVLSGEISQIPASAQWALDKP